MNQEKIIKTTEKIIEILKEEEMTLSDVTLILASTIMSIDDYIAVEIQEGKLTLLTRRKFREQITNKIKQAFNFNDR